MPTSNCGTVEVFDPFTADDVSVTCPAPPQEVEVGQPFEVSFTITNDNDAAASVEYQVTVSGSAVESGTVEVGNTESRTAEVVIDSINGAKQDIPIGVEIVTATRAA